jgi:hypothetical protein
VKGGYNVEDREIIAQYFSRDPCAIDATAARYGSYCTAIALNILGSTPDAEECVNDAFLKPGIPFLPSIRSTCEPISEKSYAIWPLTVTDIVRPKSGGAAK